LAVFPIRTGEVGDGRRRRRRRRTGRRRGGRRDGRGTGGKRWENTSIVSPVTVVGKQQEGFIFFRVKTNGD